MKARFFWKLVKDFGLTLSSLSKPRLGQVFLLLISCDLVFLSRLIAQRLGDKSHHHLRGQDEAGPQALSPPRAAFAVLQVLMLLNRMKKWVKNNQSYGTSDVDDDRFRQAGEEGGSRELQ